MDGEIRIFPVRGIPEVHRGDDLAVLIQRAMDQQGIRLEHGDVVVVAQKIVSKAEGAIAHLPDYEPSALALRFAQEFDKDPRHVEVVLRQSRRIVKMERGNLIVETLHGWVCANAGVDASNVEGEENLTLLPEDSDASAQRLRLALEAAYKAPLAVIISDSFGRPWREWQTNIAIGVSGMLPVRSHVGQVDTQGRELKVTALCVADELAGAAELVQGKVDGVPVAVIRGVSYEAGDGSARQIVRPAEKDMFR